MTEKITTYYYGDCPVCGTEIGHYQRINAGSEVLDWCDISADPDILAHLGIDIATLKRRLHVIDADGTVHVGVPAFAVLWSEMPRYRWLSRLVRLPVIRTFAAGLYEVLAALLFAYNRRREARQHKVA